MGKIKSKKELCKKYYVHEDDLKNALREIITENWKKTISFIIRLACMIFIIFIYFSTGLGIIFYPGTNNIFMITLWFYVFGLLFTYGIYRIYSYGKKNTGDEK